MDTSENNSINPNSHGARVIIGLITTILIMYNLVFINYYNTFAVRFSVGYAHILNKKKCTQ